MSSSFKKKPKAQQAPASNRFVRGIPSLSQLIEKWEAPGSPDKVFNFCDRLCFSYLGANPDLRSELHYRQIGGISSTKAIHATGESTAATILQILYDLEESRCVGDALTTGSRRRRRCVQDAVATRWAVTTAVRQSDWEPRR